MVAITSHLKYWGLAVASLLSVTLLPAAPNGVVARIAALDGDSTYMALLSRESSLSVQEDSLSQLLVKHRDTFAEGGAQASQARNAIMNIELELFDLRSEYNKIYGQIEQIEQNWSLNNSSLEIEQGAAVATSQIATTDDSSATIAGSKLAKEQLPKEDYNNLLEAEAAEAACAKAYKEYIPIYEQMREILQLYNQTDDEDEAMKLSGKFHTLKHSADSLSKIINDKWTTSYDNKYFAYNMLMEVMGYNSLLDKSGEMSHNCEGQIAEAELDTESRAMVSYNFQKRNMVELERVFAKELQLTNAIDSLSGAAAKLSKNSEFDKLPALKFAKRSFILFEPVIFSTEPVYNAGNPIPETVIYKKGTIYRVFYGAFNSKQSPTIFHGASPLSVDRAGGLWTYYGGGYETFAEAEEAAALCKERGFRRPEVVIWRDGEKRNLSRDPFPSDQKYRVQIVGLLELSEDIKSIINDHCPEAELSKVGADSYVIGPLEGQIVVEEFTKALASANGTISTKIIEIPKE